MPFSDAELDPVRRVAERDGISLDEAASNLAQEELALRIKKKTGKSPAKVYPLKGRA